MRAAALGLCVATVLLAYCSAAGAVSLPTGSTALVRLVRLHGGQLTARLTARGRRSLARRLRGHVLDGSCTTLGATVQGSTVSSETSSSSAGLDRNGHASYEFILDRDADFCDISLSTLTVRRGRHGPSVNVTQVPGPPIDTIALTQKGARYLDEDRVTARLFTLLEDAVARAHLDPAGHFPGAGDVVAAFAHSRLHWHAVVLADPTGAPSGGAIGLFTDRANRAEAVGVTRSGQRLFLDSSDGVLSSNSYEHLLRLLTDRIAPTVIG
jgi:hypothetical protein